MAFFESQSAKIHYESLNNGKDITLLFSNSLGTDYTMWDTQLALLQNEFNILRYDTRGHGLSEAPQGPYSIDLLGNDVINLIRHLNIEKVVFCGLSIGGLIGQWVALHAFDLVDKVILCNTAAKIGTAESWNQRIEKVRKDGLNSIVEGTQDRWFTPEFVVNHKDEVDKVLNVFVKTNIEGYCGCCGVVRDADFRADIKNVTIPTLIISGTEDLVTTISDGEFLKAQIAQSQLSTVHAAHISSIEGASKFAQSIIDFLK